MTGAATRPKLRTFRIGEPPRRGEGLRLGVVRYLPRGVRKEDYAVRGYFDLWFPLLAPSAALLRQHRSGLDDEATWRRFAHSYEKEVLGDSDARQSIALIAAMARRQPVALGCYCAGPHCHRFLLESLVRAAGRGESQ